ncbi:hypothetical protein FRC15_002621 [Serendipita sp. 397]|nr:hypothetical protein FRC15_002621 [Serendipita sp. 397]
MRPTKKRRIDQETLEVEVNQIIRLEDHLKNAIDDGKSLNGLSDLLKIAEKEMGRPQLLHKCLYAIYRTFSLLISNGWFNSSGPRSQNTILVRQWLFKRLDQFFDLLGELFQHAEPLIKEAATQIPLTLLKQLSSSVSSATETPQIHYRTFRYIIPKYLRAKSSLAILVGLVNQYNDIRWFTLREIPRILHQVSPIERDDILIENTLSLLEKVDNMPKAKTEIKSFYIPELAKPPKDLAMSKPSEEDEELSDEDDWRKYFDSKESSEPADANTPDGRTSQFSTHRKLFYVQSHRVQFSGAWLALLQYIKSSPEHSNRVLSILHHTIMPNLTQPIQLMDWIGACIEFDGATALLAFNALFVLIQEHNLDYPDFYTRLYALLDKNILHVRYRARFFRLLELFLSSTHLPANLLASFIKRLARLSLSAPPPAIIMLIPFTYNILKRHPSLMAMIHREVASLDLDPFLPDEPSPFLTNAISSSLWELNTHRLHYAAPISAMAQIFSEPFTKPSYVQEDFLDHTYGTLYTAEAKRKIVKEPAINIDTQKHLFGQRLENDSEWRNVKDPCNIWI